MKNFTKITLIILAIVVVSASAMYVGIKETPVTKAESTTDQATENYKRRIKQGLNEIQFNSATENSEAEISDSVRSLSNFMENRSGVVLSLENQNNLVIQEQNFRLNNSKGVLKSELGDLITEILLERASNWNEKEIASAIESWKGFNAPDLPEAFQKGRSRLKLRASGAAIGTDDLSNYLLAYKNKGEVSELYFSYLKQEVTKRVDSEYNLLSGIMPEQFLPTEQYISPLNSMLLIYSIVADDNLAGSLDSLNRNMNAEHEWSVNHYGKYPSPNGHKAYGPNGYFYSSPTDLLLNSKTIEVFLKNFQSTEVK